MLMDNRRVLALYAGCAYAGSTLFGVNRLRGDTLVGVLNQSRARARGGRDVLARVERVHEAPVRRAQDVLVVRRAARYRSATATSTNA
jgi:hypothetical protein